MDSEFSTKWNITSGQFMSTLLSEDKYFETKGNGRNKLYKKKQNQIPFYNTCVYLYQN